MMVNKILASKEIQKKKVSCRQEALFFVSGRYTKNPKV